MSGKKKAKATPHVDRARPVLNQPTRTDADKVAATHTSTASMQTSPHWAAAPDVQGAVTKWGQAADALSAKSDLAQKLRLQLATAMSDLRIARRRPGRRSAGHVLSTVNVFSQGSVVDTVKSFSLEVQNRTAPGAPQAPINLTVVRGAKPGEVVAQWKRIGSVSHGFVVQHATDMANPTTYSAYAPSTKMRCTLDGLPSGSNVYVRVAAIDPTEGLGPWSPWVQGPVG